MVSGAGSGQVPYGNQPIPPSPTNAANQIQKQTDRFQQQLSKLPPAVQAEVLTKLVSMYMLVHIGHQEAERTLEAGRAQAKKDISDAMELFIKGVLDNPEAIKKFKEQQERGGNK